MQKIITSKIELEIDNMPQSEAEILKNYFILLIAAGIHRERNGKIILYFDNNGLAQIGANKILWKKCKEMRENTS